MFEELAGGDVGEAHERRGEFDDEEGLHSSENLSREVIADRNEFCEVGACFSVDADILSVGELRGLVASDDKHGRSGRFNRVDPRDGAAESSVLSSRGYHAQVAVTTASKRGCDRTRIGVHFRA
jgi:hypothetical protein